MKKHHRLNRYASNIAYAYTHDYGGGVGGGCLTLSRCNDVRSLTRDLKPASFLHPRCSSRLRCNVSSNGSVFNLWKDSFKRPHDETDNDIREMHFFGGNFHSDTMGSYPA